MWIFDIKRFAVHDGPGIRTTVFMKGCPLECPWCHNPESRSMEPVTVEADRKLDGKVIRGEKTYGEEIREQALLNLLERDRHFYEVSGGGVTFSGGEPLWQADELEIMLKRCKGTGFHTVVDTCGHAGKGALERVMKYTDLFLYDLKFMDPATHREHTGVENRLILANADLLLRAGAKVIFRIPVLPGLNTTGQELERYRIFIRERSNQAEEIHLLPYHRIAAHKYRKLGLEESMPDLEEPDSTFMEQMKHELEGSGLPVRIGG